MVRLVFQRRFRRSLLVLLAILVPLGAFTIGRAATEHITPQPLTAFPTIVTVLKAANVRAGPGTEYPIISGARPGQRLTVFGCNSDCTWYQLAEDCWIAAFLVKPEEVIASQVPVGSAQFPMVVVSIPITVEGAIIQVTRCPQTIAQVNTYAGPGTFYPVVDTRPPGECVAIVGRNTIGDWFQLSHGMWIAAAVILYAEPLETLPITDRFFTATPEPTHTPHPTATPSATPTPAFAEIMTVGEWVVASPEHKAATVTIWTQRYVSNGSVTGDAGTFATELYICVDNTLRGTAEILGASYPAQDIADGCLLVLNR